MVYNVFFFIIFVKKFGYSIFFRIFAKSSSYMNKKEILEKIFDTLMEKGTVSEKGDILGIDTMEDKLI